MQSLLEGKHFYCREWAFSKINHCLENRPTSKTCGALVMGGPGCGKTALLCEIVWPTSNHGKQKSLNKRLLAYYFCQAHDIETLSLTSFIHCMVDHISKSPLIHGYAEQLTDPAVQACLEPIECERNPDEAFKKAVLLPLLSINPPSHNLFAIVDSIDESYLQSIGDRASGSRTIAELLANHHQLFPQWLLLVCSARKQSKSVTRMFTGFRKISLDDLRKTHVVRDVQQYILCRLDQEEELRQHLSRETAEMLNQLHIKSNGCFLYLEKVLDGVGENFIMLREIKEIPGTLNGLYLWLCQRLFVKKQFAKILPILNVILAARRPLMQEELFRCVWTKNTTLTTEDFESRLQLLSKLLIEGKDGSKILFHHSFAEWLLDVKHCTQKYLCLASEGHGMLAMSSTLRAEELTAYEIQDFTLHLSKCNLQGLQPYHLSLWLIHSKANIQDSLSIGLPKEHIVTKLLHQAGAQLPSNEDPTSPEIKYIVEHEDSLKKLLESGTAVNQVDPNGRTLLCNAAHQGNLPVVNLLLGSGADIEMMDRAGQTSLNLAARQGHSEVVAALLKSGAVPDHTDSDGWTALRSAAWGGHTDVVVLLLQAGADVDHADADQRTALRAAAWGGHDDIVLKLLEHGANVNKADNEGRTALIAAAYMGHTEIVEHLLDNGADINHEDCDGRTALSVAALCIPASQGHSGVVSLLLERGAVVDHRDHDSMTPLLVAGYEGHREVCELLLEWDADVDHSDKNGRTPLQAAASMGHGAVVNLLLVWGAAIDSIDAEGRTVLCIAAAQGSVEVVQQLLDRGLDEMHRDNAGWTPMHMAAYEGHREICDVLIEAGARVMEVDNDGRIPLILAAQEGHNEAVTCLLDAGSRIDHRSHDGKTALRCAALEGHKDVVHLLLCQGADLNYKDADGRSTLYVLALENREEMAAFLLENSADVESVDLEGRTALHVAAWQNHCEMVDLLLNHEANVNAMDNDRRTPLQSASWQGHVGIVKLLLERSGEVDHTCNQGATALCIAAQEGHEEVVKVLLQFRANPHHADQFGRTATRVAMKGGHMGVVRLLEEHGGLGINGLRGAVVRNTSSGVSPASNGTDAKPQSSSPMLTNVTALTNGHVLSSSPSDSPTSTMDRRKSYLSNNSSSKSSSNLTSNTGSTNQSSSVGPMNPATVSENHSLSFTQQLQQCSMSKNRNRPMSRVLSPVSEPQSPAQSPCGSPMSEIQSIATRMSPDPRSVLTPLSLRVSPKLDGANPTINIISNPNELLNANDNDDESEPVWQKQSKSHTNAAKLELQRKGAMPEPSAVVLGQAALAMKSPEMRRKRNGIVTNPNFAKGINMNGYYNKLANLADGVDNFPVSNGNSANGGQMDNKKQNGKKPAKRPNGLPLKKETPL